MCFAVIGKITYSRIEDLPDSIIIYMDLSSDYLHSKLDGDCLNSFWNNQTFVFS